MTLTLTLKLTVTSRRGAEYRLARPHTYTHLVSIRDAKRSKPVTGHETVPCVLGLYFDDVSFWRPGYLMVDETHIIDLLRFGRGLDGTAQLLVHCEQGISRSVAAAYIILADRYGPGQEARAMAEVIAARADCGDGPSPNHRMLEIADRLLKREGQLARERGLAELVKTPLKDV
ncbi:tyrosine phosphatase-like protein [Virus Rctr197k]|nr:tyrosine phosphatase-like protein [Virus Rctr197k]